MLVNFHFLHSITLTERQKLKIFLTQIIKSEKTKVEKLDIIFCSDDYLLQINRSFLNHDYFTDIITFDLTPKESVAKIGEIYISAECIINNAKEFNTTIKEEIHRVIFHGLLHLCGYKDKTKIEKTRMTLKENEYLSKYFI